MTGKTLKELNVQVGDVVRRTEEPEFTRTIGRIDAEHYHETRVNTLPLNKRAEWELVSRATPDLSTLSRDQLEELGQRVAVELEKKELVTFYVAKTVLGDLKLCTGWDDSYSYKIHVPKTLPPGTYISSDGNEIKVEEV